MNVELRSSNILRRISKGSFRVFSSPVFLIEKKITSNVEKNQYTKTRFDCASHD